MKIILGSSSPFRREVMEESGIPFEVVTPDIDEKKIRALDHMHIPVILSFAKAQAVAKKVKEPAIIIACDQIVICDGNILEKPESADEIRSWYKLYADYPVSYINGITVYNTETKACLTAQEVAISNFSPIPDSFVEEQISKGIVFNCAGAIDNNVADTYSSIIQGSRQSMIGLPLDFIMAMIEKIK
jgi:septum formation protein